MRLVPEKIEAHQQVAQALKQGTLTRLTYCECCGKTDAAIRSMYIQRWGEAYKTLILAHHEDYSKPLDVIWLCHSCHNLRHQGKLSLDDILRERYAQEYPHG